MPQFGLFDYQKQLTLLEKAGDPLIEINQMIDWEQFRSLIEQAREEWTGAKGDNLGDAFLSEEAGE